MKNLQNKLNLIDYWNPPSKRVFKIWLFWRDSVTKNTQKLFEEFWSVLVGWLMALYNLGWAPWNLSYFEFKFDDTRLSS